MSLQPISSGASVSLLNEGQQPKSGFLKKGQLIQALQSEEGIKENPNYISGRFNGFFYSIIQAGFSMMGIAELTALFTPLLFCISSICAIKYKTEEFTTTTVAMTAIAAAIKMAVKSPLKSMASYFATAPNCVSECYENGSCGNSINRDNCDQCVDKCNDDYLWQSAAIGIPLATIAAGVMGLALEYSFVKLPGVANRWKNRATIQNINSLIKKLQVSEQYPFRVTDSDIAKLKLSKETRQKIISGMNIAQLTELREQLGEAQFNIFSDRMLDGNSEKITSLLSNKEEITPAIIIQIRQLLEKDISIWMEIVKRISPENFTLIEDNLREIGKNNLETSHIDEVIEDLRSDYSDEITLQVENGGQIKCQIPVNIGILLKYDFFKALLNGHFHEGHQSTIHLELSDIEYYGFQDLINFIKSRNEDIIAYLEKDLDLTLSILALSSKYGLTNYLIISYEYLIKNQDKLNILELTNYLLKFANVDLLYKNNEAFIQEIFTKACNEKDYVLIDFMLSTISKNNSENMLIYCHESESDKLIDCSEIQHLIFRDPNISRMVFQYEFPKTQELIKDYLLNRIRPGPPNINILNIYSEIYPLTTHLENKSFSLMHIGIFKNLWDYSKRTSKKYLNERCLDFLENLSTSEINDVICQWPIGEVPHQISNLLKE